jgi:hypothetical protein
MKLAAAALFLLSVGCCADRPTIHVEGAKIQSVERHATKGHIWLDVYASGFNHAISSHKPIEPGQVCDFDYDEDLKEMENIACK